MCRLIRMKNKQRMKLHDFRLEKYLSNDSTYLCKKAVSIKATHVLIHRRVHRHQNTSFLKRNIRNRISRQKMS